MGNQGAFQWESIKKIYRIWAYYPDLGDFQEDSREQGFVLDWMLSGSGVNSMIDYANLI